MTKFWELLERSIIVTALVTAALSLTLCYLWLNQIPVPEDLINVTLLVFGYWFGGQTAKSSMIRNMPA